MATVCFRALYAVRWYEVSRVLSVSSTLTATKKYRNETWCKRWWHISQRNLSLTSSTFTPSLSLILAKSIDDSKLSKSKKASESTKDDKAEKNSASAVAGPAGAAEVTVTYHRGLPRIIVPLPSRKEQCIFTLKPITHTVGDFIQMLKREDRGIDRAIVTALDGTRISANNTIQSLMEDDFRLVINDVEYLVTPPLHQKHTMENIEKLSDVKTMVGQLYEAFQVREYYVEMEKQVLTELETVRLELEPMELKIQELEDAAAKRAEIFSWVCLIVMSIQFSSLARLTWWEYSWDIMEPVTYFLTYGTMMLCFIYFLLTKQEYMLPDVLNRRHLIALHKQARKAGLDLNQYNLLKDRAYELETTLKVIRGPLYDYKNRIEQKKRERSSSSSSSSSRSPSSSPSPSPERNLPKKGVFPERNSWKKPVPEETRFTSVWMDKETRGY